jgi:hypothetical protein
MNKRVNAPTPAPSARVTRARTRRGNENHCNKLEGKIEERVPGHASVPSKLSLKRAAFNQAAEEVNQQRNETN